MKKRWIRVLSATLAAAMVFQFTVYGAAAELPEDAKVKTQEGTDDAAPEDTKPADVMSEEPEDAKPVEPENADTGTPEDTKPAEPDKETAETEQKKEDESSKKDDVSGTVNTDTPDVSGTVTVEPQVSGTVTVETDKNDDNVEIKKSDKPYLALGENLTPEQQATVLSLMGIDQNKLDDYDVVYVNNTEEHQYLDSYIDSSKIGTKSLSSVVIVERKKGSGINISTHNISYCTVGMYKNALATAGIEDADIIVAAPFAISGTAALVGIFKAYKEMTGKEVEAESIDTALHELVLTGDLEDITGADSDEVEALIAYVKQAVVEHDISDEGEVREAIAEGCEKFNVTLSEEQINQIVDLMLKISELDLDIDSLLNSAQSIYDKIANGEDADGFFAKIGNWFSNLFDKLMGIFG